MCFFFSSLWQCSCSFFVTVQIKWRYPWQLCQTVRLCFTRRWRRWKIWTSCTNIWSTDSTVFPSTARHKWWKETPSLCKPTPPCVCVLSTKTGGAACLCPVRNPTSAPLQSVRLGQREENRHPPRELPDSKIGRQLRGHNSETASQKGTVSKQPLNSERSS